MNFIKRAVSNVKRQLSKTVLLSLTFFLIANFIIIGLGINNAAKQAKYVTSKQLRPIVTITIDSAAVDEAASKIEDVKERNNFYNEAFGLKIKYLDEIKKDERVAGVSATKNKSAFVAPGVEAIKGSTTYEERYSNKSEDAQVEETGYGYIPEDVSLRAGFTTADIDILEGRVRIVDGNFYTDDDIEKMNNVAVVSKQFAALNNLTVGSTFNLINGDASYMPEYEFLDPATYTAPKKEDFTITYRVVGIYEHSFVTDTRRSDYMSRVDQPDNLIFVPYGSDELQIIDVLNLRNQLGMKNYMASPEYDPSSNRYEGFETYDKEAIKKYPYINSFQVFLNDATKANDFASDWDGKIEYSKINTNNRDFIKYSKPLDTLSLFSNFIVWLVTINAIVIITLVTALTLKTREYEIGVLLSLGATKTKIVSQFFLELVIVAFIGFSLASVSGTLVSKQIGNKVLDLTVSYAKPTENDDQSYFFDDNSDPNIYLPYESDNISNPVSLEEITNNYNVVISPILIGVVYIIGMLIVLISVIIPSMMVMRYNPKKILMNIN